MGFLLLQEAGVTVVGFVGHMLELRGFHGAASHYANLLAIAGDEGSWLLVRLGCELPCERASRVEGASAGRIDG